MPQYIYKDKQFPIKKIIFIFEKIFRKLLLIKTKNNKQRGLAPFWQSYS